MWVQIFPLFFYDRELISAVTDVIQSCFNVSTVVKAGIVRLNQGRDPIRNQVNSNWILKQMQSLAPERTTRMLGLTDQDLYSPVLTYVFGEAELGGRAAVVSTHRFRNEFYGLSVNPKRLKSRLIKEVVHELGHTFGLIHCEYQGCVMYPSSYVEEIDQKSADFCSSCFRLVSNEMPASDINL